MSKKMNAWVVEELGKQPVLKEKDVPKAGPGEVLVKMAAAGICHSDISILDLGLPIVPFLGKEFILGHENAGYIAELGEGVEGFEVGEAVVVAGNHCCNECEYCKSGDNNYCPTATQICRGLNTDGGMAEYMVAPAYEVVSLGDIDPKVGVAFADAGLTPYAAVDRCYKYVKDNGYSVVIGIGGIGSYAIQYLKALTKGKVIAIDTTEEKLERAKRLGADYVFMSDAETAGKIMELTGGRGVDAVVDCVAIKPTFELSKAITRSTGAIVIVGITADSMNVAFGIINGGVDVSVSIGGSLRHLKEAVELGKQGKLIMDIEYYKFHELPQALQDLRDNKLTGRGVITFDDI